MQVCIASWDVTIVPCLTGAPRLTIVPCLTAAPRLTIVPCLTAAPRLTGAGCAWGGRLCVTGAGCAWGDHNGRFVEQRVLFVRLTHRSDR